MTGMSRAVADFLDAAGWGGAALSPLAGDASARRYARLARDNGTAVLMDASALPETIAPFLQIGEHLRACGYSAPEVYARDEAHGLLLLEDLGEKSFAGIGTGASAPAQEEMLEAAVDLLADLQTRPLPHGVPAYDPERMIQEAALFIDTWLANRHAPDAGLARPHAEFCEAWEAPLNAAWELPAALCLRDFHAGNLMWLGSRTGIARVGLLDFQDALEAPVAYDMVSLLNDARRDIAPEVESAMITRYLAARTDIPRPAFDAGYAILGAQRGLRIAGIFTRLAERDGKSQYLAHMPRVWRQIDRHTAHPSLGRVREWLARYAPAEQRAARGEQSG